jgi:hypothetical protein
MNSGTKLGAYDVAPDGQRILVNDVAASPERLNVIVNGLALLKKRAAAP